MMTTHEHRMTPRMVPQEKTLAAQRREAQLAASRVQQRLAIINIIIITIIIIIIIILYYDYMFTFILGSLNLRMASDPRVRDWRRRRRCCSMGAGSLAGPACRRAPRRGHRHLPHLGPPS